MLNALGDGTPVDRPLEGMDRLAREMPGHPYAKLGVETVGRLAGMVPGVLKEAGVEVAGSAERNHYRVTPMGTLRRTWLTLREVAACGEEGQLPWQRVAVVNVKGFLDFYPGFIADEFERLGTKCSVHEVTLPALERLRANPTEMRSVNIARVFDREENVEALARVIREELGKAGGDVEAVAVPALVGLSRGDARERLERLVGRPVVQLPTLPPSVPGIRAQQQLRRAFEQAGGVYMLGDTVERAEMEGRCVVRLFSVNHGDIPFVGEDVVLATGSFFSQGLVALPDRVYEPVLGLDVTYAGNREEWYDLNVFAPQRYETFGVRTDAGFRGLSGGEALENVYVAGAVLDGFNALKEGCGAGVSILTALYVAECILSKK